MSFHARIDSLIGPSSLSAAEVTQLIVESSNWVVGLASPAILMKRAELLTIPSTGLSIELKRVLQVSRAGEKCDEVPYDQRKRYEEPSSLTFATARSPVFYVKPAISGSTVHVVPKPTASEEATLTSVRIFDPEAVFILPITSLSTVPKEAESAILTGAALKILERRLANYDEEEDAEMAASLRGEIAELRGLHQKELVRLGIALQ